jgi:hypothetical protein
MNPILHGGQEADNQIQDPNDELQDIGTSPTAPGDMTAFEERPMHDNGVPLINQASSLRNEHPVQGTDGRGPAHCVVPPNGIDGIGTEGNAPVPTVENINTFNAALVDVQEVATHPMPPSQPRQLFKSLANVPQRPVCIEPPMHPTLVAPDPSPRVRATDVVQSDDEIFLACLQSFRRMMPCWHQKRPCRRAMSLLKHPILLLLNKAAPLVTCNQCMKPSLQGIHPRLPCKWFPPPLHPVPPRDQSLRVLLKSAWVLLPPSLPT